MKLPWGPAVVLLRKHEKNWNLAPGEIFAHSCSQHPCSQQQTHNLTISPSPPLTTEKWGSHPQQLFDSFSTIPKPKHQESCFRPWCPIIENKVSGISLLQGALMELGAGPSLYLCTPIHMHRLPKVLHPTTAQKWPFTCLLSRTPILPISLFPSSTDTRICLSFSMYKNEMLLYTTLHSFPPQNPCSSGGTKPKTETCHIVCYAPLTVKALNNTSSFQFFLTTIDTPVNILPRWNHIQLLWYLQARASGKEIKSHEHLKFSVDSAKHLSQMAGSGAGRLLAEGDISKV